MPLLVRRPPKADASSPDVRIVGARYAPFRDLYFFILKAPWSVVLGALVVVYVALNVLFAFAYLELRTIANAHPGSFKDAFFFSIQTMGTIGYGAMYPASDGANVLVVVESVVGLLVTALGTGLVFAKFSRVAGRVVFSERAVIGPMNRVPTLMLRVGNERANQIFDAEIRVIMMRTERTHEGVTFYRMYDLRLARERAVTLTRSFSVMHTIDDSSPLAGYTPERIVKDEVELYVTVLGTDDTTLQPVFARKTYDGADIVWGARHADILIEMPDGKMELHLTRFHDIVATDPTEAFPYPVRS